MSTGPEAELPRVDRHRADWYTDPTRRFEFRYHNGQDWTGDVSTGGQRYLDPLPRLAAGGGVTMPISHDPANRPVEPQRSGRATAALVLGIASVAVGWVPFLFAPAAVAAVLALVFGLPILARARRAQPPGGTVTAPRSADPDRSFARAATVLAPIGFCVCVLGGYLTVLAYREVDRYTNIGDHSIKERWCVVDRAGGADDDGNDWIATMTGRIVNESDETHDYRIGVEFVRPGTDNVLYTTSAETGAVAPGDQASWSVEIGVGHDELDCRVHDVTGPLPFNQS